MAGAARASLISGLLGAWLNPARAFDQQLAAVTEPRLAGMAVLFGFMNFIAGLPGLAEQAQVITPEGGIAAALGEEQTSDFFARAAGLLVVSLFFTPLMMYALSGIAHLIRRALGGTAPAQTTRLAFFWAALVCVPLVLLTAALSLGFAQLALPLSLITGVVFLGHLWFGCHKTAHLSAPKPMKEAPDAPV